MRILFDHGTPRGLARALEGHRVEEAKALGWDRLSNGELLSAADRAGFDVLVTTDKNLPYQQNLAVRNVAVVVLGSARWRLIEPMGPQILAAVNAAKPGTHTVVEIPME
jgi:xanthine dehydrogenase iron-sulfur cluster and FAD-binding subunit A